MKAKYPYLFEQLDNIITFELNPVFSTTNPINEEKCISLIDNLKKEVLQLQVDFRQQFFKTKNEEAAAVLVAKNYDAVVLIINKAYWHSQHGDCEKANVLPVLKTALVGLHELLSFFQINFNKYLSPEQLIPVTDLLSVRDLVIEKREPLLQKLKDDGNTEAACSIVIDVLDDFCRKVTRAETIHLREVDYYKMIINDIENYKGQESAISTCPSLHELLLFWNLNSKACIRYFSVGIEAHIAQMPDIEDRLEYMRMQQKKVNVLPQNPGFVYNSDFPSMKSYFTDYIANEISYLENKKVGFQPNESYAAEKIKAAPFKVLCALSTDQLSLFLRACKDLRLIVSRSVTAVFTAIVPFLSTQGMAELSAKSVRSKAYQGEERDKEILIDALNSMIDLIKQY